MTAQFLKPPWLERGHHPQLPTFHSQQLLPKAKLISCLQQPSFNPFMTKQRGVSFALVGTQHRKGSERPLTAAATQCSRVLCAPILSSFPTLYGPLPWAHIISRAGPRHQSGRKCWESLHIHPKGKFAMGLLSHVLSRHYFKTRHESDFPGESQK